MKKLLVIAAAAALLSGVSFAHAQSTMSPSTTTGAASSGKFCSQAKDSNELNCKFASMAACQREAKAAGDNCIPNPNASTTGSGTSSGSGMQK